MGEKMKNVGFFALATTLTTLVTLLSACQSSMSPTGPQKTEGFCKTLRGAVFVRTDTINSDVSFIRARGILPSSASTADRAAAKACVTAPNVSHNDVRWGPPVGLMKVGGVEYAKVGFEVDNIFFTSGSMIDASVVVKGITYAYAGPADTNDFTTPHAYRGIRPFEGNVILREKK